METAGLLFAFRLAKAERASLGAEPWTIQHSTTRVWITTGFKKCAVTNPSDARVGRGMQGESRLWSKDFGWWFGARGAAIVAAEMTVVILQLMILEGSQSAFLVSALRATVVLPYLLLGFYAGAFADRTNRRRILIVADFISGVALLTAASWSLFLAPHAAVLLAAAFLVWSCLVFFDAGAWGSLLVIVGKEKLGDANSKIWALMSVAGLAGPMVAVWIAEIHSLAAGLFIAAGLYLASVAALAQIEVLKTHAPSPPKRPRALDGLTLLWADSVLAKVVITAGTASFSMGAASGVLVVLLAERGAIAGSYFSAGTVFAAGAAGALVASMAFPKLRKTFGAPMVVALSLGLYGLLLASVGMVGHGILLALLWGVAHLSYTLVVVCAITLRQETTPADQQGRVNTSARVVTLGSQMAGALTAGVIAQAFAVQLVYMLVGAVCLLGVLLVAASWAHLRPHRFAPQRDADGKA